MRKPKELLAQTGREALLPVLTPPALLNTEAVAYRAAAHFSRERIQAEAVHWEEPPEIELDSRDQEEIPPEVLAFLVELTATGEGKSAATFLQANTARQQNRVVYEGEPVAPRRRPPRRRRNSRQVLRARP